MALATFLSAVRSIILEVDNIPAEFESRRRAYQELFPALSALEVEDLAKVPPNRFATYTSSIFHGETGILENHFKLTLLLLNQHWEEIFDFKKSLYALVRELNRKHPWKSYKTAAFAENFCIFLENDTPRIRKLYPWILTSARFELLNLEVKRHFEPSKTNASNLSPSDLAPLSVGELLNLGFVVPEPVRFSELDYDVLPAWREAIQSPSKSLQQAPTNGTFFALGARDATQLVRWTYLPEAVYQQLKASRSVKNSKLSCLAEAYLASEIQSEVSEAVLFTQFTQLITKLMQYRAIELAP